MRDEKNRLYKGFLIGAVCCVGREVFSTSSSLQQTEVPAVDGAASGGSRLRQCRHDVVILNIDKIDR